MNGDSAMGILRLLLSLLGIKKPRRQRRPNQPRSRIVIHYEQTSVAEKLAARTSPKRWSGPEIIVVDPVEIRGRCWVIDGDTIDVDGTRLRLAGIDAPELDHPYGRNAKRFLIRLCQGQTIRAVMEGDQTYGRMVGTCYLQDGRDLSAEMVRAGLAIDWRKFSGGKYRHLEPEGVRKRLWRCDARQKGRMPPTSLPD
jgi:micrococcal nuclease